jgi:monoamine oxidase
LATPLQVNNVSRVLFAGEATSEKYYSSVHGAMDSAQREVDNIIKSLS